MKQGKFYKITALFAVCLLVTAMLPLALAVNADGYTPSEKTVPSTVTLTTAANQQAALGALTGWNASDDGSASVAERVTDCGYGENGSAVRWTYDKSKSQHAGLRDSSQEWYGTAGDGFFLWVKSDVAGTLRLEGTGFTPDWVAMHCDAEIAVGENLVFFPYADFVLNSNGEHADFTLFGYGFVLYPIGLPQSGTLYIDAFSCYEGELPPDDPKPTDEPGPFHESELRLPETVGLKTLKNFDADLCGFTGQNAGDDGKASVVVHSAAYGFGISGGSAKWMFDKSKNPNASFWNSSEDFYAAEGDGFFLWIKSDAAGTVRLQGLMNDWTGAWCDAEIQAGENLVYFPYSRFVKADGTDTPAEFTLFGYHMTLYPLTLPQSGTLYIDSFGNYGAQQKESSGGLMQEHPEDYHTVLDDFESYTDDRTLIGVWTQINAQENGDGCRMSLDTTGANARFGNSLKLIYNSGKAVWASPGAQKRKPDNEELYGDGLCFWMKTEKAMTMRAAYLTEDCEAVFDIKDIPAGFEGYVHVPFDEIHYMQAGKEVPYEEIGFVPTDFYYFTFYCYGPTQSADYENTVWFDDFGFYAASETDLKPAEATLSDVSVSGNVGDTVDTALTVRLSGDTFTDVAEGTDVSKWFGNLPKGLKATVKAAAENGASELTVSITGTVTEQAAAAPLEVRVAARYLNKGRAVTAAVNPNAAVVISSVEPTPDEPPVPMGETLPAAGLLLAAGCGGAALVSVRRRRR